MRTRNLILFIGLITSITIFSPQTTLGQACSGHWVSNRPLTFQCISGQQIGINNNYLDPSGCPINPLYLATQTNTFIFNNPVNDFFIDFNAFDCTSPGCPRLQIKINGITYPVSPSNLVDLPSGNCSGSTSFLSITSDGYITTAVAQSNGQGRLVFSGVNASSITLSTNDGSGGMVVANPCFEPLPIQIKTFKGYASGNCEVNLAFESGIESNVRNIEVEGSFDGAVFLKLLELFPLGSDSRYTIQCKSEGRNFYRLKINDLDGSFSYSEIIRINNNCTSSTIRISPNPSAEKIWVENIQRDDQLIIVDVLGREVFRQLVKSSSLEINIQNLPTGLYFLKVFRKNSSVDTAKFLKS
ncbi:MAG: T9SS type A sorting domain-containing protein [Sphingobacteriales bacterium]|nr:T9SS type A sorting domain-containing protein [Sphingobacteriales bacterium]